MRILLTAIFVLIAGQSFSPPATAQLFGKSAEKRITGLNKMREETLAELYDSKPQAKAQVAESEGYAVFSNVGVQLGLLSAGGGTGIAHDTETGGDTYMRMATGGVGIGLGIKDFRAVFVFHDREAFDYFVDKGWDLSGQADAAAQAGGVGDERSAADNINQKVTVYQFTENGIALAASLNGTKYWKDEKLNNKASQEEN